MYLIYKFFNYNSFKKILLYKQRFSIKKKKIKRNTFNSVKLIKLNS